MPGLFCLPENVEQHLAGSEKTSQEGGSLLPVGSRRAVTLPEIVPTPVKAAHPKNLRRFCQGNAGLVLPPGECGTASGWV